MQSVASAKAEWNALGGAGRLAVCILCGWTTRAGRPSYTARTNPLKDWDELTPASQRVIARYLAERKDGGQ